MTLTKQQQQITWKPFDSSAALQAAALEAILQSAKAAIAARGRFSIVLAGGATPREVYQQLREAETDWSKWHVFFGDERCLPPDHAERNSRMAQASLLDHVPIPRAQIHPMPAELGAEAGARAYSAVLQAIDSFDLVLLGMGEDGHTASLFPGRPWESTDHAPALAVYDAPKPPPSRISLAASRLSLARRVIFLISGQGKQDALQAWRAGTPLPVTAINPPTAVVLYCCF